MSSKLDFSFYSCYRWILPFSITRLSQTNEREVTSKLHFLKYTKLCNSETVCCSRKAEIGDSNQPLLRETLIKQQMRSPCVLVSLV